MRKFDKDLNLTIAALDVKFLNMEIADMEKVLHRGLIDMIESTINEIGLEEYEELTDWCIMYCQIKYKSSHPLNRFFDM